LVAYTAERGYGWDSVKGMGWRDRQTADPLTRDFHWGTDNTFEVNVPNGTYDVTVTLGDASLACSGLNLALEGQPVATNLATAPGKFLTPTYRAQVTAGRLDLHLTESKPGQHFAIDGLVLNRVSVPQPPTPPPLPGSSLQVHAGS